MVKKINRRFDIILLSIDKDTILEMLFLQDTKALINLKNRVVKLKKLSPQLNKCKKTQA